MKINPNIFRAYDIRGIVDKDLNSEIAELIGKAFGTYLLERGTKDVLVSRDTRATSEEYQKSLTQGLLSTDCNVIDIGLTLSSILYFARQHYKIDGGVMVTASVSGDTPILIKDKNQYKLVPIESLESKELNCIKVLSIGNNFKINFYPISYFFKHNVKKIFEVRHTGGSLLLTGDHSVFVFNKDYGIQTKKVSELKKGDFFATFLGEIEKKRVDELDIREINSSFSHRTKVKIPEKLKLTPELLRLMGYYLAEGWTYINPPHYRVGLKFGEHERQKAEDAKYIINTHLSLSVVNQTRESGIQLEFSNKNIGLLFENLLGKGAHEKHLPFFIWTLPREQVLHFLSGYLGDSHLNYRKGKCKRGRIEFTTASKKLAQELVWLLRLNGISSTWYRLTHEAHFSPQGTIIKKSKSYVVIIPSIDNSLNLSKEISRASSQAQRIPTNGLKELWSKLHPEYINNFSRILFQKTIKKSDAKKILSHIIKTHRKSINGEDKRKLLVWKKILSSELGVAEVKSIKNKKWDKPVYDISVPKTEAFFGGGCPILLHNSHNPPEWNGFKLCHGLNAIVEEEIRKVGDIVISGKFKSGRGKIRKLEVFPTYLKEIKKRVKLKKPLKVVVDGGNATPSIFVPRFLKELGCEVIPLHCDIDPTFPRGVLDPIKLDYYQELIKKVREEQADLGILLDGDGDRVGFVDEKGNIWLGDIILLLLIREIIPKNPGRKVIVEVKDSEAVVEETKRLGGIPIFWKTGHALLDHKVFEEKAILCGEMSCHYWITDDWYYFDDAIYALARVLKIISDSGKSLSELVAELPKYEATPEYRIDCPEDKKFKLVQDLVEYFRPRCDQVVDVDGIRGYIEDSWFLIRASNTQPLIVVRCEAKTKNGLEKIKKLIKNKLDEYPYLHLDWEKQP